MIECVPEQYGDSTQLLYLRARYYNPANGRFLSKDPSGAESNLYLYARGNPVNRIDPSGLYSKLDIVSSLNPMALPSTPGVDFYFSQLLNKEELKGSQDSFSVGAPKWGFLAALLDAENGDRLEMYQLSISPWSPSGYKQIGNVTLGQNSGATITGNGMSLWNTTNPFGAYGSVPDAYQRGNDPRYYKLHTKNGVKIYFDGASATDYPDFTMTSYGTLGSAIAKEILAKYLGKAIAKCLSPIDFAHGDIIDRYGNKYTIDTLSISHPGSLSLFSTGEGHIRPYALGPSNRIIGSEALKNTIQGLSGGPSIYIGNPGIGGSISTSGAGAVVYSMGLQWGVNLDFSLITYTGTDSTIGWQSAIDLESGNVGSSAIFRQDLEAR